eukprot:353090-Rhodomonas_salina.2
MERRGYVMSGTEIEYGAARIRDVRFADEMRRDHKGDRDCDLEIRPRQYLRTIVPDIAYHARRRIAGVVPGSRSGSRSSRPGSSTARVSTGQFVASA